MAIQISNLNLRIGEKLICQDLNLSVARGECWAILGVNGVGKTTLLHKMIDVDAAQANCVTIDGMKLPDYRTNRKLLAQRVGLLLQDYEYNFPCTVFEAVLIGRHPYATPWQWQGREDQEIAEQALKETAIYHLKERLIDSLSGGEKRRLNLAMLLAQNPDYLLLDEPTNHLDIGAQIMALDLIEQQVKAQNKAAVMVMHDANLALRYCENVLMLLGSGSWLAGKSADLINEENLEKLYGCPIVRFSDDHRSVYLPG